MANESPEEMLAQQKANCIFCKIIAKEIPSQIPYEDEDFIAIMDIRPATKGHVLLMPKEHYPILPVIPQDIAQKMFVIARKLVSAVEKATLNQKGTIFIANGGVAGQQSPHFIMHIMPREDGDGIPLDSLDVKANEEEYNKVLAALKARFKPPTVQSAPQTETRDPISDLAEALEQNPDVKQLIIDDPEKFKDYVKANPQLEALFQNIDIDALSKKLKEIDEGKSKQEISKEEDKKADLDKISNLFK